MSGNPENKGFEYRNGIVYLMRRATLMQKLTAVINFIWLCVLIYYGHSKVDQFDWLKYYGKYFYAFLTIAILCNLLYRFLCKVEYEVDFNRYSLIERRLMLDFCYRTIRKYWEPNAIYSAQDSYEGKRKVHYFGITSNSEKFVKLIEFNDEWSLHHFTKKLAELFPKMAIDK